VRYRGGVTSCSQHGGRRRVSAARRFASRTGPRVPMPSVATWREGAARRGHATARPTGPRDGRGAREARHHQPPPATSLRSSRPPACRTPSLRERQPEALQERREHEDGRAGVQRRQIVIAHVAGMNHVGAPRGRCNGRVESVGPKVSPAGNHQLYGLAQLGPRLLERPQEVEKILAGFRRPTERT